MEKNSRIYIAGHSGLVGSALQRELERQDYNSLVIRASSELDLRDQKATEDFFSKKKPEYVFLAAAKVGGIKANMEHPAEFIYDNIQIQTNVIHSSWEFGIKRLLFLGSNCMYPKDAPQPFHENSILSGKIEPTNEPYGAAKIAGMIMCQAYNRQYGANFVTAIPATQFGPNDNFSSEDSHFIPALIRKFHEAKEKNAQRVVLWGTGRPRREIMYVDDLAKCLIFLMNSYSSSEPINIGVGYDLTIEEIGRSIGKIVGFRGEMEFDRTKPDGIMKKLLDSSKISNLGWKPQIDLEEGLAETYKWFRNNAA